MTQAGEKVERRIVAGWTPRAWRQGIASGSPSADIDGIAARFLGRVVATPLWLQTVAAMLLIAFYAERIGTVLRDTGLFRRVGFDWGLFYSQAAALAGGDLGALYDVERLNPYLQRLVTY